MTLSVIIVSFNVKYFLEQCLCSVQRAVQSTGPLIGNTEIIVVDNHSEDGSIDYLRSKFPEIEFIANPENTGFAKANNQALARAKGKYILFLNPDTIVSEDSFSTCIRFLESDPHAGAAGVRMINGRGRFLKESMRGFPYPWTSFCKLSGLTAIFPHSKLFASYYLGHLNPSEINRVDVLSGAFMIIKKEVLDKSGGFDEQFFMYAEDIDLSYRMQQAGYTNFYLPGTTIIHFKGESTQKDLRYVKLFYKAMEQFMQKHFRSGRASVFFMQTGLWLRSKMASLAFLYPRPRPPKNNYNTFLTGDETTVEALKTWLPVTGRNLQAGERGSNEIIFCEGPGFSFKKIIRTMEQGDPSRTYKIHASGSGSIVGSHANQNKGERISL